MTNTDLLREIEEWFSSEGGPLYQLWENLELGRYEEEDVDWPTTLMSVRDLSVSIDHLGCDGEPKEIELYRRLWRASKNPLLEAESPLPDPERSLAAKEELSQIEKLVADRPLAALIVGGMCEELSGSEIKQMLGISQTEYETEMKWLRRNVRDKARKAEPHV